MLIKYWHINIRALNIEIDYFKNLLKVLWEITKLKSTRNNVESYQLPLNTDKAALQNSHGNWVRPLTGMFCASISKQSDNHNFRSILGIYLSAIKNVIFNWEIYILEEWIKCVYVCILKKNNKMWKLMNPSSRLRIEVTSTFKSPLCAPSQSQSLPSHNHSLGSCINHSFWFSL